MSHTIEVLLEGQRLPVKAGECIGELLKRYPPRKGGRPLAAKLNQHLVSLETSLRYSCRVTPVTYDQREGTAVYRRSACLILFEAVEELYPEATIVVGQSLAGGYYFDLHSETPLPENHLAEIEARMRLIVSENRPFQRQTITSEKARE